MKETGDTPTPELHSFWVDNEGSELLTVSFEPLGLFAEVEPGYKCEVLFDLTEHNFRLYHIDYGKNSLTLWDAYPYEIYQHTAAGRERVYWSH